MNRKAIFEAIRAARPDRGLSQMEVAQADDLLDRLQVPRDPVAADPRCGSVIGLAIDHLEREEGRRAKAYRDHLGYWTIGVGRLIDPRKGGSIRPDEESVLIRNDPTRKPGAWRDWTLTESESDLLLANDIRRVIEALESDPRLKPAWSRCVAAGEPRRCVALVSMAFQMGRDGLAGFKNTLAMIAAGRFDDAADNALLSKWAKQTPARAARVTDLLR